MNRKVTPRVRDGRVQKKNRWEENPADSDGQTSFLEIIRRAPGPRCVHIIDETDVRRFVELIPDWKDLSRGLRSIVLEKHEVDTDGWCRYDGVIALPAWRRELVREVGLEYYAEHRELLERIGVPCEPCEPAGSANDVDPTVRCWFDEATARAFLLLHVFLHELGHHVDEKTRDGRARRGEEFAEAFAYTREARLW